MLQRRGKSRKNEQGRGNPTKGIGKKKHAGLRDVINGKGSS